MEKPHVGALSQVTLTIKNPATFVSASHSYFALSINTNDFWIYLEEEKYHPGVLCQEEFAQFSDVLYFFHIP